jgi:hypothetical protein
MLLVPDTAELFSAFAEGMRAAHGKLLVSGIPRMTRPRKRKNADNLSGFTVIDPGGNWIGIHAAKPDPADKAQPLSKLARSLLSAVVMGDSHGKHDQAARILDNALRRDQDTAAPGDLLEALAYRAELAVRADDPTEARDFLTRAEELPLTPVPPRPSLVPSVAGRCRCRSRCPVCRPGRPRQRACPAPPRSLMGNVCGGQWS